DAGKDLVWHAGPVGGHGVLTGDHSHRYDVRVRSIVTHHADRGQRGEDGERLPYLAVQAEMLDLVDDDPVGIAEDLEALGGDLTQAANRKARARERLPVHHLLRHPELDADRAHLVLEQVAERLDELET